MTTPSHFAPADCTDVHAHGVPESFVAEIARSGLGGVRIESGPGGDRIAFPGEEALRPVAGIMTQFGDRGGWLAAQDVSTQFVAPWLDVHGQQLPAAVGGDWTRLLNDCLADAVGGADTRLRGYATLHLADPEAAATELARCRDDHGFVGCMLPTNFPGGYLEERRFDAIWSAACDLDIPVVLHPPTVAPSGPAFARYPALRTLARAVDTTVVAGALLLSGVLDRFPDLRLVLVHGGGFLPYQVGRLDQSMPEGVPGTGGALASDLLRRLYFDTASIGPEAVAMLVGFAGPDRVMVGSDYAATTAQPPWREHTVTANLHLLGGDDATRVRTGTAATVFPPAAVVADH